MERRDFLKLGTIGAVASVAAKGEAAPIPASSAKLLVTVGNDDWFPTPEEMLKVRDLFVAWLSKLENSVLIVRQGINVQSVHVAQLKILHIEKFNDIDTFLNVEINEKEKER
jgi:hypothetical protein